MKYQVVDMWGTIEKSQDRIQTLYDTRFDKVILYGPHEWNYWQCKPWDSLVKACSDTGHKLTIVTSTKRFFTDEEPHVDIDHEIINWPTHYFSRTYVNLESIKDYIPNTSDFKHHFVSMNYRPREWRCLLMDLIAKNKVTKSGEIPPAGLNIVLLRGSIELSLVNFLTESAPLKYFAILLAPDNGLGI